MDAIENSLYQIAPYNIFNIMFLVSEGDHLGRHLVEYASWRVLLPRGIISES